MLSYDDAIARILAAVPGALPAENVPLEDSLGRALAEDTIADADLPPFDNSSVDGYAIDGSQARDIWRVTQEIRAGDAAPPPPVAPGDAAVIYTGAPFPPGADRVVMLEDTELIPSAEGVRIRVLGSSGDYIRRAGSDLPRGATALHSGTAIDAGAIGLLASLDQSSVYSARRPRVGLLSTGDELIPVGGPALQPGQIRNSSAPALTAAVTEAGGIVVERRHAIDTPESVREAFLGFTDCDVILSSGGVSVGGHDYVKAVVEEIGSLDFWRIAVRPGKPLAFGRIGESLFVGLPGNPVSSLVTFELFVRPILRKLSGFGEVLRPSLTVTLAAPLPHTPGRREFARAQIEMSQKNDGSLLAVPLGLQDSHRLSSMAGADLLLIAHEDRGDYAAGESLPAFLLR